MKRRPSRGATAEPPTVPPAAAPPRHCPDTRPATAPSPAAEQRARHDVYTRLARRFPGIPAQVVQSVAAEEFALFDTARIRHYVPVLVLRRAGDRLARIDTPQGPR